MDQFRPRCLWIALAIYMALTAVATRHVRAADPGEHPASSTSCSAASFKVALDIGHHKAAPGAIGATGIPEFEYNKALGQAALAALRNAGFKAVFLIGASGDAIRLEERTQIAAQANADLFLSLHHDSVQPAYLSETILNGETRHYSDIFHGYSIFISDKNPQPRNSRQFADLLGEAMLAEGLTPSLHHAEKIHGENRPLLDPRLGVYRFDDLIVLKTATMPAALLESGIIVNRAEEQALSDGRYHRHVVAAIVKAVQGFCNRNGPTAGLNPLVHR